MSFDLKLQNGDLVIGSNGDLSQVVDNEKLRQDVLKILITPVGGNKVHSWYGSSVAKTLIGNVFDKNFSIDSVTQQVRSAIENLQILQKSQSRNQVLSAAETIVAVKDVYVNTNPQDQRVMEIKVSVLTSNLTTIDTKFYVKL